MLLNYGLSAQSDLPYKPFSAFDGDTVEYLKYNFTTRGAYYKGKKVSDIVNDLEFPVLYIGEVMVSHPVDGPKLIHKMDLVIHQYDSAPHPFLDYYVSIGFANPPASPVFKSPQSGSKLTLENYMAIKDLELSGVEFNEHYSTEEGREWLETLKQEREINRKKAAEQAKKRPVDYVDVMIGMSNSRWMLFPGPTMPFGMVKLSPDNQDDVWMGGYEYTNNMVSGFSHIHEWTMGGLSMLPVNGDLKLSPGRVSDPFKGANSGYHSRIIKEKEVAKVGYYSTHLFDYGITAELASTYRCGFQRYTFPQDTTSRIVINLKFPTEWDYSFDVRDAEIRKVSDREIEGYVQCQSGPWSRFNEYTLHFVLRFSKPFKSLNGFENGNIQLNINQIKGKNNVGAFVSFHTRKDEQILVQSGISFVSIDNARLNLDKELNPFDWNFDAVVKWSQNIWNKLLSKIEIEGKNETDKIKFYTNLYRSYGARTMMDDVNGEYRDACEDVAKVAVTQKHIYSGDAFWNTFWNCNGLWSLITPDVTNDMVNTQIEMFERTGWTCKGPAGIEYSAIMEGSHELALMAAAYQKGIRNFDAEKAYRAMKHTMTTEGINHPCGGFAGNPNLNIYAELGFMPCEKDVISKTLDYAFDDYCTAQMAKALGKNKDYEFFLERSQNYRNCFDPETKYVRQRHADGRWKDNFDRFSAEGFIEGNSWQYSWYVPHDVRGLVNLIGADEFNNRLITGFEKSEKHKFAAHAFDYTGSQSAEYYINHGNEINMQSAYLFNFSGKPWLTQKYSRAIMDSYYGHTPLQGWEGDEDQGQMGAWFVMSAMGFFEMDGGVSIDPMVEISSPLFEKITIHLDNAYYSGETFTITASNNSPENIYIQSARLNGEPLSEPRIYFKDITKGGELVLEMGPEPNVKWGVKALPPEYNLRVASYNIRYNTPGDGINAWPNRKEAVKTLIKNHDIDIAGTQEGLYPMLEELCENSEYVYFGAGLQDGEKDGQYSAILYKKDKFSVLDSGHFWLSETPDIPSKGWDAGFNRVCSWIKFREDATSNEFYFFNVHLDHQGVAARRESVKLMIRKIKEIAGYYPIICTGDFNSVPDAEPIREFSTFLSDARNISELPPSGPEGTFTNHFTNPISPDRIDYVFVGRHFNVKKYAVLTDYREMPYYPSDHLPVIVDLSY